MIGKPAPASGPPDAQFWLILAVSLVARGGLLALYPNASGGGDQGLHYVLGVLVSHLGTAPLGVWAPGYEVFLGAVFALFGPAPVVARIAQVLLSVATVALVYGIARHAGGVRAGRIAGWLCAMYPSFVAYTHYFYSETLFLFLLVAAVYALVRRREGNRLDLARAGLLFGLCILTRSVVIWFLPIWAVWEWLRGRGVRAREVACILAIALLVVLPWTARNALKYRGLLLVDGTFGRTVYLAYSETQETAERGRDLGFRSYLKEPGGPPPFEVHGETSEGAPAFRQSAKGRNRKPCPYTVLEHVPTLPDFDVLETWFPDDASLAVLSGEGAGSTPEQLQNKLRFKLRKAGARARLDLVAYQRCELPRALSSAAGDPGGVARDIFARAYRFWGPNSFLLQAVHGEIGEAPDAFYPAAKWAVVSSYLAVMLAALLTLGRRRMLFVVEWSALFVTYYFAIHCLAIANSRYRLPIMPFVIVLAALWLAEPRRPEGRWRSGVVWSLLIAFSVLSIHYVVTVLP